MKSCLMHSIAIYDSDDNLVEVLYVSNTIFSLECAKRGHKYKTNNGTVFDSSKYHIIYDSQSDLEVIYIIKHNLNDRRM